jgi:hypothetical protein
VWECSRRASEARTYVLVTPRQALFMCMCPSPFCAIASSRCSDVLVPTAPSSLSSIICFVNSSLNSLLHCPARWPDHKGRRVPCWAYYAPATVRFCSAPRDNGLLGPVALSALGTQGYSVGDVSSRRNEQATEGRRLALPCWCQSRNVRRSSCAVPPTYS